MSLRAAAGGIAVVAALASLTGCAKAPLRAPSSDPSASAPTASQAPKTHSAGSSTASPSDDAPSSPSATLSGSPSPMLTPQASADSPLGAGERVWAAFSERGLSYDAWWAQLRPLLGDAARATYVYDDPRNLPAMKLTGDLRVAAKAPAQPHYSAEIVVPTSKGTFRLDLERHTLKSKWLLYAIKFPPGVH